MIHIILGTKAQLIKMAPVMVRLQEEGVRYNFISTGQHRATMDEMLAEFGLKGPDVVLYDGVDIVSVPQMVGWAARILWQSLAHRQRIFGSDRNGVVLVHGDTLSTLLGALAGRLAGLRVGHVESGLRSFHLFHPFPEELTRVLTFRLSHLLFCPGSWAMANVAALHKEAIDTTANTMADSLDLALSREWRRDHVPGTRFALVSLHRYENIFNRKRFSMILDLLEGIAASCRLLFILHPPTEKQLRKFGFFERLAAHGQIELRPRYSFIDFAPLLHGAEFVVTDGGSIQEETSFLGIPCLLLRKATERREGLDENVVLSGYDQKRVDDFVRNVQQYRRPRSSQHVSPSAVIVGAVRQFA